MKSYHRVLLLAIPVESVTRPPAAMPILAACCEKTGAEYHFFDLNLRLHQQLSVQDAERLKTNLIFNSMDQGSQAMFHDLCRPLHESIDRFQPDLIAISVFTYQSIQSALLVLDQLEARSDRRRFDIVMGGSGVSSKYPELLGQEKFCDWVIMNNKAEHVIIGEAECSFVELLKGNHCYPGINGQPAQQIMDLDQIPTPSFKKINPLEYFYIEQPELSVTGSKGCVRDCSFCNVASIWKKYVYRSGANVADDLFKIWQQTSVRKFDFSDSLINGSIKNFREMNQRLIELKQSEPNFDPIYNGQFICRPIGQMKYRDYVDMKAAGVGTLVVGIEHFSPSIRQHMGKDFDNAAIDWHFETCARLGIQNVLLLMSGYVTETISDHEINLQYLKKYQSFALTRVIHSINIEPNGLAILEGTPLSEMLAHVHPGMDFVNNRFWINPDNSDLTPLERTRRGAEVIYTAADLGYNVLHFTHKIKLIKKQLETCKDYSHPKVFGIRSQPTLTSNSMNIFS